MDSTINFVTTIAVSNLPADPSTGAKQDAATTAIGLRGTEVTSAAILAKLSADPATQTTLAAVLAKIVSSPALDTTVGAGNTLLTAIKALLPTALGAGGGLKVDGSGTALPISGAVTTSGTVTASLGTTDAAHLATVDTSTASAATKLAGGLPAALGAGGGVKIDGSGTALPVSLATLPALVAGSAVIGHVIADSGSTTAVTALPAIPTGSNTIGAVTGPAAAALALEGGHLATIDTSTAKIPSQGQALAAASMPVVLPAIQVATMATSAAQTTAQTSLTSIVAQLPTALAANGGIKVEGVAGGVAIPTSSALGSTAANQVTAQTSLTSIDGKAPALGQALAASSVPVVLTAIQVAQLAQETTQATGNTSLATLVTNSPALVSGRVPVVVTPPVTTSYATLAAAGALVKSGAGILYSWHLYNATGNSGFMMVFDLASAGSLVSGTTKPIIQSTTVVNNVPGNINFVAPGMAFTNGIVIAFSSTAGVYTTATLNSPTACNGHVTTNV